jgi:hypothetical protein
MPSLLTGRPFVAKDSTERDRVDLRCEPRWLERIRRQAERTGVRTVSAYIRQAATRQLIQDEREEAELAREARGSKRPVK